MEGALGPIIAAGIAGVAVAGYAGSMMMRSPSTAEPVQTPQPVQRAPGVAGTSVEKPTFPPTSSVPNSSAGTHLTTAATGSAHSPIENKARREDTEKRIDGSLVDKVIMQIALNPMPIQIKNNSLETIEHNEETSSQMSSASTVLDKVVLAVATKHIYDPRTL